MALEAGSRLGPYEVVELVGSGGMGEVYRARDPRLGRDVAVKILSAEVPSQSRLRRFEKEARAAGALNHPNILAVYDVGTHDGTPYVVSELLEGETLRARLGGALPVRKALDFALQMARALGVAHDKGIVHRDLKPENLFITHDGRLKILDFGLAKLTRSGPFGEDGERGDTQSTESGMVVGTVGYMSPEQVRGEAADHRSDVFSFGTVLYEMLSGQRAFRRDNVVETLNAILKEDPPGLSGGLAIPPGLTPLVHRCLEKRAGDRFRSAHDLALALEAVSSGSQPALGEVVRPTARFARRHKTTLQATLALAILLAGGLYWDAGRSPEPPSAHPIDSVAVLPFENIGGDADNEYLSDGMAETLISHLSQVPELRVMARSSTFRLRGTDPIQAGRELGVEAVVTGRVSLRADSLVVATELLDTGRDTQLWSDHYDGPVRRIEAVQQDIADALVRELRGDLKASGRPRAGPPSPSVDPEAHKLVLQSRYELHRSDPKGVENALEYARRVTEQHPHYASGYVVLAHVYQRLGRGTVVPHKEAFAAVKAAATKAVELDETLAEAHAALADAALVLDWDWATAQHGFERAIELNPGSAAVHEGYGLFLTSMGFQEKATQHLGRAVELDFLTPQRHISLAWGYYFGRQFESVQRSLRQA